MKSEIDNIVDDLLSRWHRWRRGYQMTKGYSSVDAACRDHRSSTRWDWLNGAEEDRADELVLKSVDAAVDRIAQPWRTAIEFEARNLAAGCHVWSSPRLPTGEALEVIKIEARNKLIVELHREGVVGA